VGVPVVLQDERLTSREAESFLARREKDWRRRKPQIDALAAALILQDYLDGPRTTTDEAGRNGPRTNTDEHGRNEPPNNTDEHG
jgi:hypothetical protein